MTDVADVDLLLQPALARVSVKQAVARLRPLPAGRGARFTNAPWRSPRSAAMRDERRDPHAARPAEPSAERQVAFRAGVSAESRAAALLIVKGFRILARRWKTPVGEIDIVARRRRLLVFVEVKTRQQLDDAAWSVTDRQRGRIAAAAERGWPATLMIACAIFASTPCWWHRAEFRVISRRRSTAVRERRLNWCSQILSRGFNGLENRRADGSDRADQHRAGIPPSRCCWRRKNVATPSPITRRIGWRYGAARYSRRVQPLDGA